MTAAVLAAALAGAATGPAQRAAAARLATPAPRDGGPACLVLLLISPAVRGPRRPVEVAEDIELRPRTPQPGLPSRRRGNG